MASRMEKYYKSTEEAKRRIYRNEQLYKSIYEDETYSNIEGIVATPSSNEIDINKIRELINNHEEQKRVNRLPIKKYKELDLPKNSYEDQNKIYDIKDVLESAKSSRENNNAKYYSLKNTEYDILKGLDIEGNENTDTLYNINDNNTLNQLGNTELSLNIYEDLSETKNIKPSMSILEETKVLNKENTSEMDRSFYTSSLGFNDNDFEQLSDLNQSLQHNTKLMRTILIILFIIIGALIIFGIFQLIK